MCLNISKTSSDLFLRRSNSCSGNSLAIVALMRACNGTMRDVGVCLFVFDCVLHNPVQIRVVLLLCDVYARACVCNFQNMSEYCRKTKTIALLLAFPKVTCVQLTSVDRRL